MNKLKEAAVATMLATASVLNTEGGVSQPDQFHNNQTKSEKVDKQGERCPSGVRCLPMPAEVSLDSVFEYTISNDAEKQLEEFGLKMSPAKPELVRIDNKKIFMKLTGATEPNKRVEITVEGSAVILKCHESDGEIKFYQMTQDNKGKIKLLKIDTSK